MSDLRVMHQRGMALVDANMDQLFRRWLYQLAPNNVRPLMKAALDRHPHADAAAYSHKHFGEELPEIARRCSGLITELQSWFERTHRTRGFEEWLMVTGYGNDYRMIQAMNEWALMKRAGPETKH